jgi:ribonuclease HII
MPSIRSIRASKTVTAATAKQRMLKMLVCSDAPEQALRYHGYCRIAGVDEVGRGALFGPELAAAGLKDSKQLTREERETLDLTIRGMALAFSVAEVDAETIDKVNIYQASRMAMLQAVMGLAVAPDHLLIDAMRLDHPCKQTKLIYGDALSLSIAAASVIAKVHRDALMRELDLMHPGYGLASHKGYGTPEHRRALVERGPSMLHRRTFAPVRAVDPDAVLEEQILSDFLFEDTDMEEGAEWA